jgi:molecular chaperone HtpG
MDQENQEQLFRLVRFNATYSQKDFISLEDYISKMKEGQEKIYFVVNPSVENALGSPFMEPFKGTEVPVIILTNNIDEICFS